jgi:hypothetical protein
MAKKAVLAFFAEPPYRKALQMGCAFPSAWAYRVAVAPCNRRLCVLAEPSSSSQSLTKNINKNKRDIYTIIHVVRARTTYVTIIRQDAHFFFFFFSDERHFPLLGLVDIP